MNAERFTPIEKPESSLEMQLLSAYKKGNALLPQTNFGVVSYVGEVMTAQAQQPLFDLLETVPDASLISDAAETMNARHARYGVRPFDATDVLRIYRSGVRLSLQMTCAMAGVHSFPKTSRQKQAVEFLLHPNSLRRQAIKRVFSHVTSQFDTPTARTFAKKWRSAIGCRADEQERNRHLSELVDHVRNSWYENGHEYDPPFWYGLERISGHPMAVVHFGQLPDHVLR